MSVARKILREKEIEGIVVPYIREGGFVVYTTPSELAKREGGAPIMVADALEEIASSVPKEPVITEEMDLALAAASSDVVKPSKLARKRREAGEKKERKDLRPEVIVEPLEIVVPKREPVEDIEERIPKKKSAPKQKPAKKIVEKAAPKTATKKKTDEKEAPTKAVTKKAEEKATPKKGTKKEAEKKEAPKKAVTKKAEEKSASKKAVKKEAEKKPASKKVTKKEADKKPVPKKATTKKEKEKAAPKKTTKKK